MARAELRVALKLPGSDAIAELLEVPAEASPVWFRLRSELAELMLFRGFDELLCLPTLRGVDRYWYQIETARKVLKQFKGRVLLADEVGLGKTIEAGMVLKEYVLRGMAERVLILAPPALVGQWQEELREKFSLRFESSNDAPFRSDPEAFWSAPRIIASLALARREEHAEALAAGPPFDLVIVDEAHRLKNRTTRSYRLVHQLRTRFLLLLSATPVQNNLVELFNLLTLLQPGIFRTEREFRSLYMTRGSPRTPRNRDELRSLMRGVLEGGLSPGAKDAAIAAFREAVPVLLSSESGGEGRNLQFCNTVIHFDLPWNPMAIEQRIGRVHRIGQTREVFVFNLVTHDTVEDALLSILNEKLDLFELVVGEVDAILGELDQELDFAELVYRAWVEATPETRERALEPLGAELVRARGQYESTRALDEELFADELEVG
jgi:SNF2 family DNA or RNA helicase